MKSLAILTAAVTLLAPTAFAGHREDYRACAEEHLAEFLNASFSPEQAAGQIVDLHCAIEAIQFAQILAKAQSGNARDAVALAEQIGLLRDAVAQEIRRQRGS